MILRTVTARIARSVRSETRTIRRWLALRGIPARAQVLARLRSARLDRIDSHIPITNPSIAVAGGDEVLITRNVTYRLSRLRQRAVPLPGGIAPETFVVRRETGALQRVDFPASAGADPIEDGRVFAWRDGVWGLWSQSRLIGPGAYTNAMVLGRIRDGRVHELETLDSPHDRPREKNWMPLVEGHRLRFMYDLSRLEVYERVEGGLNRVAVSADPVLELDGHSGSSQFVRYGDAWVGVSHRNLARPRSMFWLPSYYYWHYLVVLNDDLTLREVSKPFFFTARGVEYCAGLVIADGVMTFSFGINDARAALLRMPVTAARSLFERDPGFAA